MRSKKEWLVKASSRLSGRMGTVALLRTVWGMILVIVGVIGLIMPIMPGWVFLIPGLVLLSERFPRVRRLVEWAKEKSRTSFVK